MALKVAIVGLPNVGKSTLFNALTETAAAQAANYPFCTIEPNVGEVAVPDPRLDKLAALAKSATIVPTRLTFVDIAGETDHAIVAFARPVGFSMAAQVDRDGLPPTFGDGGSRPAPRAAGLPAAVQKHHGTRLRVAQPVSNDADITGPPRNERFGCQRLVGHQQIVRRA